MTTTTAPAATRTPAASGGASGSGNGTGSGNSGGGGGGGGGSGGGVAASGGGGGALMIPGGYRGRSCSNSGCHRLTAALGAARKATNPATPADNKQVTAPHPAPN